MAMRHRAAFVRGVRPDFPGLDDEMLLDRIEEWLPHLLTGKRRLADISATALALAVEKLLDYDQRGELDRLAPAEFVSPAGSHHPIDYSASGGPTVEVRAQALFGLAEHPTVAGGQTPLILAITSPAGRPIQTTKDLPGFWAGSWRDVAKDMRGRYSKHPWPDDPASAPPTLRTKRAQGAP
jgi:ATP-dependent helicase HrpB